jgi:gluconolactonase
LFILLFAAPMLAQYPELVDAELELIANGFQFVEGPVWKDGAGLLFSDIPASTVYLWTPESDAVSAYLQPSGNSNGLALDAQGRLLLAQHGNRRIARIETDGTETALATHYDGHRLNSPNDMTVKSDGSIFFTDPPWGISPGQAELDFHGIYRLSPAGKLQLLDATVTYPNGIAFSPDESILYADNSDGRTIYAWDVVDDTTLANKRPFAVMSGSGAADGMKVDPDGYLFAAGPSGVWVYAPDGTLLETIQVPGQTTNCNWGDTDRKSLYITSGSAVYRIRIEFTEVKEIRRGSAHPESLELYANYPNPFNSATLIPFYLSNSGSVQLNIFNLLGQHVDTLVDRELAEGYHQFAWDANHVSSGVYTIQLSTPDAMETGRCLLLK